MRLADSDARPRLTKGDGVTKLSLSVVADRVLALRQPARKKADAGYAGRREMPFDDPVPF